MHVESKGFTVMDVGDGLIRPKEAARFLAISERHLYSLAKAGAVPSVRYGNRGVRYMSRDLADFVRCHRTTGEGLS